MSSSYDVEVVLVVDSSGSMERIKQDTEGGINAFIEEQKKVSGTCKVTLVTFSSQHTIVYSAKPLEEVPAFELHPRGNTALLDTIGHTINSVGDRIASTKEDERPQKVFFVISTDGQENCSREFTRGQVFDMIKHQTEKYKWDFVYLGANQDAIQVGANLGISADRAVTYQATGSGTEALYRGLSKSVSTSRINQVSLSYNQQSYTSALNNEVK